jgi:Tfp pilus assembly protein PilO
MSRNYLEAFAIVLVSAALGFFSVFPKYGEWQDVEREISEKNAEIATNQEYYANLKSAAAQLEKYQESFKKINTALPEGSDAPALMDFIQITAAQSGLVLETVDYNAPASNLTAKAAATGASPAAPAKRSLQNYGISADLSGSYADFKNFMSRIEHSSRLINAGNINITVPKDTVKNLQSTVPQPSGDQKKGQELLDYKVKLLVNYY